MKVAECNARLVWPLSIFDIACVESSVRSSFSGSISERIGNQEKLIYMHSVRCRVVSHGAGRLSLLHQKTLFLEFLLKNCSRWIDLPRYARSGFTTRPFFSRQQWFSLPLPFLFLQQ
jgi:hypothetical protein